MKNTKYFLSRLSLLLAWLLAGCSLPSSGGPSPHTWIDAPVEGLVLPLAPVIVQSHASDLAGVAQFELYVDGVLVSTDLSLDLTAGALVSISQTWTPTSFGEYMLEVEAVNTAGAKGRSLPVIVVIGTSPGVGSPKVTSTSTAIAPKDSKPLCLLDQLVAPEQLEPADGADVTTPVHFAWSYPESGCHPHNWRIDISELADFSNKGWAFETLNYLETDQVWPLPAGACYYWRVLAYTPNAYGPPSSVRRFCIPTTPLPQTATFTPITPAASTLTFTPAPTFDISGVVWNDGNGNSLREPSEGRLPDVGVELRQGSCGGPVLSSLMTGTSGEYNFTGLAVGSYCVRVKSPPPDGWTATTPTEAVISVGPGDEVNFGYIFFG